MTWGNACLVLVMSGEPRRILKATDVCDNGSCDATAYHRLCFHKGTLDFCNHHFEEKDPAKWESKAWHLDESWAIP